MVVNKLQIINREISLKEILVFYGHESRPSQSIFPSVLPQRKKETRNRFGKHMQRKEVLCAVLIKLIKSR